MKTVINPMQLAFPVSVSRIHQLAVQLMLFFGLQSVAGTAAAAPASAGQGPGISNELVQLAQSGLSFPPPSSGNPVQLISASQDYKHITFDVSCHTLTPIQIGQEHFAKGLGMHTNGNALFHLKGPYVRFLAKVGIDTNPDTQGTRGSASFAVKVDGQIVAQTPVITGGESAQTIDVPLKNRTQLELIVTKGGTGIEYDQADWGDARLVGRSVALYSTCILLTWRLAGSPPKCCYSSLDT
jgi:hypothetical protein